MTNSAAIGLAVIILAFLAYDGLQQDWTMSLFLARKGMELLDFVAFWR